MTLPPLGFTLDQRVSGLLFVDRDGNGLPDGPDLGLGGITVTVSDRASAAVTTLPDGRFTAPVVPFTIAGGFAVVRLPTQWTDQVSALLYQEWDGDGVRAPDEPLVHSVPVSITLGGGRRRTLRRRSPRHIRCEPDLERRGRRQCDAGRGAAAGIPITPQLFQIFLPTALFR